MDFLRDLLRDLFAQPPCPAGDKADVEKLIEELIRIGKTDDYLSEHPGAGFNGQCRHMRTREIGKRLDQIGGMPLMEFAHFKVRRKAGRQLSSHLEYAWADIGKWVP